MKRSTAKRIITGLAIIYGAKVSYDVAYKRKYQEFPKHSQVISKFLKDDIYNLNLSFPKFSKPTMPDINLPSINFSKDSEETTKKSKKQTPLIQYTSNKKTKKQNTPKKQIKTNLENRLENDANPLIKKGLISKPEDLIYLTRVGYFETSFDPLLKNNKELEKGYAGIYHTILNRYNYDKKQIQEEEKLTFGKKDGSGNLIDIAFNKTEIGKKTIDEFSCISANPKYFSRNNPDKKIKIGRMDEEKTHIAYDTLIKVLNNKIPDPTNGALFYQNPSESKINFLDFDLTPTGSIIGSHI